MVNDMVFDVFADDAAEHLVEPEKDAVEIEHFGREHLPAAKSQELPSQGGTAFRGRRRGVDFARSAHVSGPAL